MSSVLFVPQPGNAEPWLTHFLEAAQGIIDVSVLDHDAPLPVQFASVQVVVDQGGHGTRPMIDAAAEAGVRLWQVLGTGLDHTEVDYILARGLVLANTPGQFSAIALAEHALMLILTHAKRLHEAERNCRNSVMYRPMSQELAGQVLAIVGLGASGGELSRRAAALGMRVHAVDVVEVPEESLSELGVERFTDLGGLDDVLAGADYVSVHVPLMKATHHLIDARRLSLLQSHAVLINVARGALIDEMALAAVIAAGSIGGAGLDAFSEEPLPAGHPFLALEQVVLTPHTAGFTGETSRRRARACVENAMRVLNGQEPLYTVAASGWA